MNSRQIALKGVGYSSRTLALNGFFTTILAIVSIKRPSKTIAKLPPWLIPRTGGRLYRNER
jgi:hypothetical protein